MPKHRWLLFFFLATPFSANGEAFLFGDNASPNSGSFRIRETMALEFRASVPNRATLNIIGGALGFAHFDAYSAAKPLDIYKLSSDKIRLGILSPAVVGLTTIIPLAFAYSSQEVSEVIDRYFLFIMMPAYLLNPEIRIIPIRQFKLYAGYSFNWIQDVRTRPIFGWNVGAFLSMPKALPGIRAGYERILYRQKSSDNFQVGITFGLDSK
jgi:hypothetical protein